MNTAFAGKHRFDRVFWPVFVVAAWLLVFVGFRSSVEMRFAGAADYEAPAALVIHVFAFSGWFVLLAMQLALSRLGRIDLHRQLGWAALVLIPVMACSAIAAEVHSERFYVSLDPETVRFFPIPAFSVAAFVICAVAAVAWRKSRPAHLRLLYLATSVILVATFFRWWGDSIYATLPGGFWTEWVANYVGTNLLLAVGIGYDLATRGKVHSVLAFGVPLILAGQLAAVAVGQSDWWPATGSALLGL